MRHNVWRLGTGRFKSFICLNLQPVPNSVRESLLNVQMFFIEDSKNLEVLIIIGMNEPMYKRKNKSEPGLSLSKGAYLKLPEQLVPHRRE